MRISMTIAALLAGFALAAAPRAAERELLVLSYHDVVESPAEALADPTAVTVDRLVQHFSWLRAAGYEPISLAAWAAAGDGEGLPPKPVLLTFDDGYASFYHHVLPLLELYRFPAVVAPVTGWIDTPQDASVQYGDEAVPRERFLTWAQLRDAVATGLVEVASHSHDMHHGIVGNPFGNTQPAAVTRGYDADSGRYESEPEYLARVRADLARSSAAIARHLGVAPRAIVWPYGAYNAQVTEIARSLGMEFTLTLDTAPNPPGSRDLHRKLIGSDMSMAAFAMTVRGLYPERPLRAAHVDLDYVYDADPAQQARNLDQLLDRIKAMNINRVFLQAFADPDGDGVADALYFPNRHLPMRADLFNRVAWQLRTRAGVEVFAWMPVLAFELPDPITNEALAVLSVDGSHTGRYHRLSPFHPEARRIITEIYADLGRTSHFAGVLFHDDALLDDTEDVNPAALEFYRRQWGATVSSDGGSPQLVLNGLGPDALARARTRHLIEFTEVLAAELRLYHPQLATARNLYARVATHPESERWFAQNLELFLASYDYTAIMAMPYLEEVRRPTRWLADLVERVREIPGGIDRTVFHVQTVDWRTRRPLSPTTLKRHLDLLLDSGARHIAWYPDDFIAGHPSLEVIRSRVSLADFPAVLQ